MLRTASRTLPRRAWRLSAPRPVTFRHLSTAPPHQLSRSWKNSAARWGIAIAGVYWYNTTSVFAEEPPAHLAQRHDDDHAPLTTLESLSPSARRKRAAQDVSSVPAAATQVADVDTDSKAATPTEPGLPADDIEGLEDEAHSEGAFNPETGEINWDCPCLGGMAHGPCGPEFREAFSCFVYSKEEPKGMDCIDRFKNMQNCFRQHPDVYGAELEGDEDEDDEGEDVHAIGHEDAGVAAAAPEDTAHVAALAEKIKEEDRERARASARARASDASKEPSSTEDAQVSAAKPAPVSADDRKERQSDKAASTASSFPSSSFKEPKIEQRPMEDEERPDESIVPHAAYDARDAEVPKKKN